IPRPHCLRAASTSAESKEPRSPAAPGWLATKVTGLKETAAKTVLKGSLGPAAPSSPAWSKAINDGERIVHSSGGSVINPRELLGKDLTVLTDTIRRLLGSGHPVLTTISNYYFHAGGKHVRPLIVLLMAKATSRASAVRTGTAPDVDAPTSAAGGVSFAEEGNPTASVPFNDDILSTQRRLAEITEMIHTASLLHDDVIDLAETRRGRTSANAEFGNKMAVLAGDFLLARASVALARLRDPEVVELLATVISDLVEGEFMQLRNSALAAESGGGSEQKSWLQHLQGMPPASQDPTLNAKFEYYMEKTYLKTASLIAKSARATAVLGGAEPTVCDAAYAYGKNLGLAFQLVDDLLDLTSSADAFGKPVNADLKLGLATAPVLYAAEEYDALHPLIERNFKNPGDVETV
ncbi:coq1 putative hexaprenyl diphosphate synthase, partial [Thoreauomyces humboldtii]